MEWKTDSNSLSLKRTVTRWGIVFTEHWTFSVNRDKDTAIYKLRVVGENGEVCRREEIPPNGVDREVRAEFEDKAKQLGDLA